MNIYILFTLNWDEYFVIEDRIMYTRVHIFNNNWIYLMQKNHTNCLIEKEALMQREFTNGKMITNIDAQAFR